MKYLNDHIKGLFVHHDDIKIVDQVTKDYFGEKPEITAISKNHAYKVDIPGKSMKVRFRFKGRCLHDEVEEAGIRVPKVIAKVPYANSKGLLLRYAEWIEGKTYSDQLANVGVYKDIPMEYYFQLGEILAKIGNIEVVDGRRIGMSDIYWLNFVINKEGKVYLTDTSKLYLTDFPEFFIFTQLLCHQHTPDRHQRAFVNGYLSKYKRRPLNEKIKIMGEWIKGLS